LWVTSFVNYLLAGLLFYFYYKDCEKSTDYLFDYLFVEEIIGSKETIP